MRRPAASAPPFPLPAPKDDLDEDTGEGVPGVSEEMVERTSPHLSPWRPLRVEDMRPDDADSEADADDAPLLQSLRRSDSGSDSEDSSHGTEPGKGLN
jgi:hypothetical protein